MPSGQRQQQKAATAQRIFEAALALFSQQGYAATTVEQIVRTAGVAKGTFFTHFASKDALLDHLGTFQMNRIAAALAADPAFAERDTRAQLQLVVATLAAGLTSQPAEMRALAFEITARRSLFESERQRINDLDALIEQIVATGQVRNELRADLPAARMAALARTAYFLAVFEWLRDDSLDLATLAAQFLDAALDGIAAHP
jgi:TetR/AcrR family transcriptional regulator, cholesterol catabolism regulator